jgi:predicted PurR-regulated permease PerM
MTIKHQLIFWGAALCAFLLILFLFKNILLPFVLGGAIAYLLNPIILKLTTIGLRRSVSAVLMIGLFFTILLTAGIILLPILFNELSEFTQNLPRYYDHFVALMNAQFIKLQPVIGKLTGSNDPIEVAALINGHSDKSINLFKRLLTGVTGGGRALFDGASLLLLTPVVAFFMIREWPGITDKIEDLLPRDHRATIHRLWDDIDTKLSGFVRGQITVAFILGIGYALALSVAGLKYGILVGLLSGVLSIIPLFGSLTGLLVSILIAWFQTGNITFVALITGIFLIGQLIEGNALTPKLVGDSVGLHPLWIIFALMAGGSLFGILGMLIAVPVAATTAVLLGFILEEYKDSAFYKPTKKQKPAQKK